MTKLKDFLILLCCIQTFVAGLSGPLTSKTFDVPESGGPLTIYEFTKSDSRSVRFEQEGVKDDLINIEPDGILKTRDSLNWEKKKLYTLWVKTTGHDGSLVEGPYNITIIVQDINDHAPQFSQEEYNGEVREQSRPGMPFIQVFATDKDDPATPNAQLVYSIKQQLPDPINVRFFQINNQTGEISTTINGTMHMMFGDGPYKLVLEVSDLAERPFSNFAKVSISIKENLWKPPKPVTIVENSTRSHPYNITKVTWNDNSVIYELHQREKYPRFPFAIDQNGNINVTEPLDREEQDQYIFYALAKNFNGVPVARPLTIEVNVEDINDNPPVCPAAETIFEIQNNEAIGSVIGILKATDMDQHDLSNSVLRYSLRDQWPETSTGILFNIGLYDGSIQLINAGLNTFRKYNLNVQVSDEGKPSYSTVCSVVVNVIDMNDHIPIFESFDYGNVTLREDAPLRTLVKEIEATDNDDPRTGSSFILYNIVEGDPDKRFIIETNLENNRGYVRVAAPLDYETYKEHKLKIEARNPEPLVTGISYNDSSTTYLKIIVTDVDERPIFGNTIYHAQVREDVPIGTKLIKINASDPEGDTIQFSLRGDVFNWLKINEDTGDIFSKANLDRERKTFYEVEVIAAESKNPTMSSSVYFQLFLDDVNDNYPRLAKDYYDDIVFCYPLTKTESFEFSGIDDDQPKMPLRFRLGGNATTAKDWTILYVNASSARLTMQHYNFPKETIYVPVIIRDAGRPPLESSVSVPVRICTCNSKGKCENEAVNHVGFTSIGMALGILFGTLAVIGIIIAAVFISINKKKKKTSGGDAINAAETVNLRT
ncbi:cadherin-17 [Bufo gargarizans]|uniref:cadherin-17 n=1 Tax=Bufo gargarizans TaxID=30331 RepID=UPI001CF413B1|nr:cadherin-17 [Bufo gargarizans]